MNQFSTNLLAGNFDNVGKILESFLNQWWGPLLGVLTAAAAILGIAAGLKYMLASQSGDEQKLKQAKNFAIGIFVGIIIVFLIAALVPVIVASFQSWFDNDAQEFMSLFLNSVYSENSRIFILDPENEYQVLAKNLDGLFIDIGSATQGRINPLHVYPVLTDEGDVAPPEVVFNAHLQFLEDFFKITLKGIAQDAFEELNNLIKLTYESVGIKHDTDCTDFKPEQYPTFDTLKAIVEKEMRRTDLTPMRKANLERVNTYVQKFATGGMYSSLWNGPSTLEVDSRFVVFNFQSLFGAKNQTVANAQILVVMRYLDMQIINIRELNRNGYGDVVHPFIVLDEGYNFIDADYPVALQFAYLWYKRIRKYEGSIFFLTQNLSDIFGNEKVIQKTSAIVNNSQYSFVFGLAPADLEILTDLYKNVGGLNPTERAFISDAGNGDCFAICSARQRTRFHVEAHDTVRAIFENIGKPWEESE